MDHNAILEPLTGGLGTLITWRFAAGLIGTMPQPKPDERWYGWLYAFLQWCAANHIGGKA